MTYWTVRGGFLLLALAACGKQQMSSSPVGTNEVNGSIAGRVKVLSTAESTASTGNSSDTQNSDAIKFSLAEVSLNQGGVVEVTATLEGGAPQSSMALSVPQAVQQMKAEFLDAASGTPLASGLSLDSSGKGQFKIRLTSEFMRTSAKVTAPGSFNGKLTVQAQGGGSTLTGALPVRVSNVALFVMSGVTAVEDLPATFEFPAGTIPVFANPPAPASPVVPVFHFQGGGGAFRHQNTGANMAANVGYCPINSNAATLVTVGGAVPAACLPCPAEGAADITGSFYNHNGQRSSEARAIICKRK
jgi:hypothetical protein